ncbi:hypothetical protein ACLJYM_02250 [Rhizobium giardinii]|uniref:hypothetical protein n=1 Tax=Rhizobium giardinii TaxID=56731 RepID=UPI0039DFF2FC
MSFDISSCGGLMQRHIDWLTGNGVPMSAIIRPSPIRFARGHRAIDGRFEHDPNGYDWFVFSEATDLIFWRPGTDELATLDGRAFAINETMIDAASTYSFGHCLHVFESPLDWLRAARDGCVVVNWRLAFDRLRYCPRIAIAESLLPIYDRHMTPVLPELFILRRRRETAA